MMKDRNGHKLNVRDFVFVTSRLPNGCGNFIANVIGEAKSGSVYVRYITPVDSGVEFQVCALESHDLAWLPKNKIKRDEKLMLLKFEENVI